MMATKRACSAELFLPRTCNEIERAQLAERFSETDRATGQRKKRSAIRRNARWLMTSEASARVDLQQNPYSRGSDEASEWHDAFMCVRPDPTMDSWHIS